MSRLLGLPVDQLTEEHLRELVSNEVHEHRALDYKLRLPNWNLKSAKLDFLEDVAAMANSVGGVILYGVQEGQDQSGKNNGLPDTFPGVGHLNLDDFKLTAEHLVRDGTAPRLGGLDFSLIPIENQDSPVLALGVTASLSKPHEVVYRRRGGFRHRTSAGNGYMDPTDLRRAFLELGEWEEQAREFCDERARALWESIASDAWKMKQCLLVTTLPLGRLRSSIDLRGHVDGIANQAGELLGRIPQVAYDFDGVRVETPTPQRGSPGYEYVQCFRSGAVEMGFGRFHHQYGGGVLEIQGWRLRKELGDILTRSFRIIADVLTLGPPHFVSVSHIAHRKSRLTGSRGHHGSYAPNTIRAGVIGLAPQVTDGSRSVEEIATGVLLHLWQTGGWSGEGL